MIAPLLQRIFLALLFATAVAVAAAELQPGSIRSLVFRDVDGTEHSTSGARVTIITAITRQKDDQAQAVADRIPDRCLGNPRYQYITLINFQRKVPPPLQGLTRAIIRTRLNSEADRLRPEYNRLHLMRDPRKDIFVVADFDGTAAAQLGLSPESDAIGVFVFDGKGKLIARWKEVPPEEALVHAIDAAE